MKDNADKRVADTVKGHWVNTLLPDSARPFGQLARFDRPIGWWLLLLPCWWSTALAAVASGDGSLNLKHILLFVIGAVVMRGAGCTYNDIVDRDIDKAVARTASRPIASGRVSISKAIIFVLFLGLIGLFVLLQFNTFAIFLGFGSLGFVAIYPFMKRITNWPQVALGFAFSWGALMGWAAHFGEISAAPLALYLGAILWTVGYDTIYAHQDREDDVLAGVKSTARLFGDKTKPWLFAFYTGATALFGLSFFLSGAGILSYTGLAIGAGHMVYQVAKLDINDTDECLMMFRSNRDYGLILFAGLTLDVFF